MLTKCQLVTKSFQGINKPLEYWSYSYTIIRTTHADNTKTEKIMAENYVESPSLNKEIERLLLEGTVL